MNDVTGGVKVERMCVITCFYNPARYSNRLPLYRKFRTHLRPDLLLVTVECATGDAPFELDDRDADIVIRVRGDVMWQKERLLNLALGLTPKSYDIVAWFDCDVVMESLDWPDAVFRTLETNDIVQLFSHVSWRGPCEADAAAYDLGPEVAKWTSVMFEHCTGNLGDKFYEAWTKPGNIEQPIADGYAWAARREVLDRFGFYDGCIIGAGTRPFALVAMGRADALKRTPWMNERQLNHLSRWVDSTTNTPQLRSTFLPGVVNHLWHGPVAARQYATREWESKASGFDPATDIVVNDSGAWVWAARRDYLSVLVYEFFRTRSEGSVPGGR